MHISRPIIIFGAAGLVGSALREALSGFEIFGFDLEESPGAAVCDVARPGAAAAVIERIQPGIIINAVGFTQVDQCETRAESARELNAAVPGVLARAAGRSQSLFVHLGTDFIFDGLSPRPYLEDDLPSPLSVYGSSKLAGEKAVRQAGGPWLIVRTAWLFGHAGRDFVQTIVRQADDNQPLAVVNDQTGSPTYALDLARGIKKLIELGATGTVNLVNSGQTTWYGLARRVLDLTGYNDTIIQPISSRELNRPARRPAFSVLDTSRVTGLTGETPRGWEEALAACLDREGRLK